MFALPPMAPLAQAANLPFVQFGEKEFPIEEATEVVAKLIRMKGWEGLEFTINMTAPVSEVAINQNRTLLDIAKSNSTKTRV